MASFNKKYYGYKSKTAELDLAVEGLMQEPINPADIEQVTERAALYFKRCSELEENPGVAGLCVWLGITTERWSDWCAGREFANTHKIYCERLMTVLEANIEARMQSGAINPVTAMFLLKTQFGYIDTPQIKKTVKPTSIRELPIQDLLRIAGGEKDENGEKK